MGGETAPGAIKANGPHPRPPHTWLRLASSMRLRTARPFAARRSPVKQAADAAQATRSAPPTPRHPAALSAGSRRPSLCVLSRSWPVQKERR